MKNFKLFSSRARHRFLLLMLLTLFTCGNAWGAVPTGWTEVTSLSGISAGDKIIIVTNDGSKYFNGTQSSGHFQVTALSASAPASASAAGVIELVSVSSNTYKLKLVSTNKYVTASAAKSGSGVVNSSSDDSGWTFSYSSGFNAQYQKSGQQAYCRSYNNSSFRTYASTSSGNTFKIYKYSSATVAAPTFGVAAGTYNNNQSVTLSCATDGATIYYTSSTNGVAPADPTSSSTAYSSAITVDHDNTIIKAIAIKGGTNSTVASATYRLTCATPTFSPAEGAYVGTQSVTISSATTSANIYYTTNGSTPTTSSTLYSGAITVSSSQTIKALVTKSNYTNSAVGSAAYTITPAYTVTWKNQGSTVTTTNVASGSKPVFPDMSAQSGCSTYTYFYGWAEGTWTGEVASPGTSSTVKVYKTASEMPNVTSDGVVYHAVWGDSPGGWTKASSIAAGDVVIFVNETASKELSSISASSTDYGHVDDYSGTPNGTVPLTVETGAASGTFSFKNGNNYLCYNSDATSSSNYMWTITDKTNYSSWTVSISSGDASINNKANTSRWIRYNSSQPRISCYNSSSSQNAIQIYKQSADANCVTSCCNQLGTIGGAVSSYTQTSVTLEWTKLSNVAAGTPYTVTASGGSVGAIDLSGAKATCTVTGLSCGTAYTFSITAHGTTGYCDKTQSGIAQTTSSYSVSYTVTNGTKTSGDATTCGPLTAVFSANSGYHLPDKAAITVTGASDFSWTKATGTLTITAIQITGNISISFTCPADACTDAFSLHTGTKGGGDWLYNKCFSDADWGAVDDAIWTGEFPSTNECYVGWEGGDSYHGAYWAVGGIKTYDIPNGRTLGWNGSDYYSDYPATAIGTFHIYKNSTDANYYLRFKPTTYVLRTGSDGTSWTSRDMTVSGVNANYYESEFITLTSTMISENAYVDLKANNANGHVWCNFSNSRTASGNVKVKNGASTFRATDLQAADNGSYGKFQIDITQDVDNWKLAFVPYYQVTYNANGGTGSTSASSYVEVGSTAAAASNGFTAPTGKQFSHWNTDSGDGGTSYNPAASVTLTGNVVLYAIWEDINYTVTVNQSPSVGATTTGQTSSAHYNGTINLTTTVPDGYRFVNWTTSDGFSISNNTSATTASFTMPAKNVTVTANFQQTHTVTWLSNGSNYVSPVTYDHGASLTLPAGTPSTPGGCSSKVFVGWAETNEITVATSTAPTFLDAGSLGTVTADKTYRAVFADEEDDEVTYSYGWEAEPSSADWEVSNITRSNTSADVKTGSYGGHVQTASGAYIKLKHQISPTSVSCYYTKTSTNTNQSSSFALEYWVDDGGGYWDGLALGRTMNNVTQGTWYELSWSGSDKTDTYVRVVYSGTNAPRALDDLVIVAGGTTYDNYITLCSSCTTPSNLAVGSITSTGGTVTWDGVSLSPTPGFKVAWNTSNSVPGSLDASNSADVAAGTNSYAITGLTPATQYYVFVKSKCNDTWSSSTNFHTNAKITYAANGGSGSMDPKEVTYNTNVTVDACTFTAPSGKKFNGWVSDQAVTVGGGSTTSVPDGATITSLTKAITLTAQWRDLASYTVNFSANNGTVAGGTSTTVYEDGTLTFPNVTSTTCGTFQGWVEAAYDSPTKPSGATFHEAGDEIDVTVALDDKTYYAVYAEVTDPTPTNDYVKVECEQTDWEGDYLIVSEYTISSTDYVKVFNGGLETLDASGNCVADVTITSKTITSNNTTDGYKFTISAVAGQAGKFYIKSASNYYIGYSGASNGLASNATASATYYNTISYDATNSRVLIYGNNVSPSRLAYNSNTGLADNRFRYYSAPDGQKNIQLYKKGGAETVNYNTSPSCSPTVALTSSFTTFTYVYNAGPSASQTFMVSGSNLGANTMTVTAPTNYEVSKDNSTFSSSVSYTPSDGSVAASTVYIRLAAGLSVGTYNYAQASGLVVACAGAGATAQKAALNGSVTKAAGSIAFTSFNAVDHYEAEMAAGAASVDVTLTVSVTGDGAVSYSRSPAAGSSAVPATTPTTTLHVTTVGTWTVTANLAAGTNYTSASTNCQVVVYYADRFYDNVHGNDMILKRNDTGEDHYTIPSLSDESRLLSGSCSETHYHFMGWVPESALSSLPNDAAYDAVMITGGGTQSATGTNYYAVWAEE